MEFQEITSDKKRFLPLLLLGDEQEDMIDRYLDAGRLFVLLDARAEAIAACVVTESNHDTLELKNIAVAVKHRGKGLGRACITHIEERFKATHRHLIAGTGEVPSTMNFYLHCGFSYSHRVKDFFTDFYNHVIIEDGIPLKDMVYFAKNISSHSGV